MVVNVTGETIVWQGASSNAPGADLVQITSINYEGGKNVFGTNVLRHSRDNPGRVSGQVLSATNGNNYKYKISFTVTNNGVKAGDLSYRSEDRSPLTTLSASSNEVGV